MTVSARGIVIGLLAAACCSAPARAAAGPLDGTWRFLRNGELPLGADYSDVRSDSSGILYIRAAAGELFYDGLNWGMLPDYPAFIRSRTDFWTTWYEGDPSKVPSYLLPSGISHWVDGRETRYTDSSSCLEGNTFRILGLDAQSRAVIDQRIFYNLGGPSKGVLRFSDGVCEPIDIGLRGEMGVTAYARDSAGSEYFATQNISDVPMCMKLLKLSGGRLDTLADHVCIDHIQVVGDEVYAGGDGTGILVIAPSGEVRRIISVKGRYISTLRDFHVDRHGVLWVSLYGLGMGPEADPAVMAMHGADTVVWSGKAGSLMEGGPESFAEDRDGNVWLGTDRHGVAVFLRPGGSVAVRRTAPGMASPVPAGPVVDALGRRPGAARAIGLRFAGPGDRPSRATRRP